MRGALRLIAFAASIAAGSWVGLHRDAPAAKAPSSTATAEPAPPPAVEAPESSAERTPWPRLNPEANLTTAWRLAEGPHRMPGDKRRLVTLTFDDGPNPDTTPKVLELLDRYGVKATFFAVGRYLDGSSERAKASREALQKVAAAGHLVGNHTHDHAQLTAISHTQVLDQIDRGAASIERAIGRKPVLFRPPFGELDDFGVEAVRTRGLDVVLWRVEVQDMERDDVVPMFRELVKQLRYNEGGVVLLHDVRWTSVKVLERLLVFLDAKRYDPAHPETEGYSVVDLPTWMRELQASPPQAGARPARRRGQS